MGSSSKTPSATTNTTKQELPAWLDTAAQDYMNYGRDVASRPYEGYGGQQIAGFGQDQANAFQGVRDQQGLTGSALTGLAGQAAGATSARSIWLRAIRRAVLKMPSSSSSSSTSRT